ncbi:6204_t:CDS:2 [Diversispora eburnea]|uniref:6204_t:CDS:1 n=1 Tax=Diversispora eburnea TaxID=1213867 RepID=A0A9N8UZB6_9GLOM|nr:6204_t:CDS:2 [Diversispora eburnea]
MENKSTSAFTTHANSLNPKYHFNSMTNQQPQIYGEHALDHKYSYIGSPSPCSSPIPLSSMLPSAPISVPSPNDSIFFPRLHSSPPPPGNIFLNSSSFPLPSVNQAIGDVDRTRNSPPPLISNNNNKRKWEATEKSQSLGDISTTNGVDVSGRCNVEETRSKIRRSIEERIIHNNNIDELPESPKQIQNDSNNTTTITCYHASVAQKSYGSEKRFLCPPPVLTFERPNNNNNNNCRGGYYSKPEVSMSVVCESGERSLEQKTLLDENMKGTFKYLHVSGTAKAKHFTLKLKIFHKNSTIPYASIDSSPVTIISKPSKKTAKARNVSSCILSGSQISLFNRINSQTVRTKYMGIEGGPCSSPSNIPSSKGSHHFNSSSSNSSSTTTNCSNVTPITYGSEIILSDPTNGFTSDRMIIRKVEKGRIAQGACGPVSQMQKIALQCVRPGARESHYLSAAGPITMDSPQSQEQCTVNSASSFLGYQPSRVVHMQNVEFSKELFRMVSMPNSIPCNNKNDNSNSSIIVEEVDDYLCWTIVGISKFQRTYYEPLQSSSNSTKDSERQSGGASVVISLDEPDENRVTFKPFL